jgi:1-acyl-sn-glycerol-3-phosphate acyltransferase
MRKLIKISGAEVIVKGIENLDPNETYLFVANHQGNYDIPLLYTYSPVKMAFIAKQEMEKLPFIGRLMKLRRCIFLNRNNPKEGIKVIQEGIDLLKKGENIAFFIFNY